MPVTQTPERICTAILKDKARLEDAGEEQLCKKKLVGALDLSRHAPLQCYQPLRVHIPAAPHALSSCVSMALLG